MIPGLGLMLLRMAARILIVEGRKRVLTAAERRLIQVARQQIGKKALEIAKNIAEEIKASEQVTVQHALSIARVLSSGRLTGAQLARMGHPYRIGGTAPQDPAIINRQTGAFFRGWRIVGPEAKGGNLSTRLVNDAPHAALLFGGTQKMVARPILERIDQLVAARRAANFRDAIGRALLRSR